MMATALASDVKSKRRQQWAWYFYDFGNSAYAAVVVLAFLLLPPLLVPLLPLPSFCETCLMGLPR